ncbi:hypothetical protein NM688_g8828 [Phlebia brevispora]|uniref:Uncharacterized protein n=1 Tax=Phlebia brevispora TaxID=194682 RepID=A0ACC1RN61_9APHY|nr:hypothetical protein NM688_g8828 [Phlebia brevispora]
MSASPDLEDAVSSKSIEKTSLSEIAALEGYDEELVKKTWRKVDWHIMPVACMLYLASYIDRANIGNAKVLGLYKDLGLTDNQYNLALSIFFAGYVVFETPSNIIIKRTSPRWYIPIMTVIWGITCALFSLVRNSSGLAAARFFLGFAEAGFLPGIVFWMGSWYPRPMQGRRFGVLYSSVSLTGAFGGLLATAIHTLDGAHGIAGWKWIFIVEGCITAGFGLLAFIFMTAGPTTAKFLTPTEREIIIKMNEADRALRANEGFSTSQIKSAFTDWRTYVWSVMFLTTYIPVYSVVLSLPTVVSGLGYSGVGATLMAVPPYGLGFIVVLLSGWTVDRFGHRFLHYTAGITVTIIALIILMAVKNLVVRYIMFFFIMFMCVCPHLHHVGVAHIERRRVEQRAAATGLIFSLGNCGGVVSGQIYRTEWAPRYVQGHAINIGCYALALAAGFVIWWSYRTDNIARDKEAGRQVERGENMLGDDLGDLGDRHPHFRYLL